MVVWVWSKGKSTGSAYLLLRPFRQCFGLSGLASTKAKLLPRDEAILRGLGASPQGFMLAAFESKK